MSQAFKLQLPTHITEIANHYQRFIPTAISKGKKKLNAFKN
jgi:hypothetical protein